MAEKQLSDGGSDGTVLGQSATDVIGFHGATPADQRAYTAAVSTSVPIQAGYGYSVTQAAAIVTLVNEMQALLIEKGLMAAS